MKKTEWYRVLFFFALFCCGERVSGQFAYSSISEYSSVSGQDALVRVDHTNSFYVPNPMMSPLLPTNSGYIVKAMEIVGTKCWFAGTHWWETGEILFEFGQGGAPYMEVEHCGFIGQFDVADVIAGSGDYKTMDISGT